MDSSTLRRSDIFEIPKNGVFPDSTTNNIQILKKVELPVVPRNDCERSLRKTRLGQYFELHDSFICAGGKKGQDTCDVRWYCLLK